jgi:hypothetical protein
VADIKLPLDINVSAWESPSDPESPAELPGMEAIERAGE